MYTNAGCSRLVDYYFVVSCDDRGIGHIKEKLKHESLAPENEKTARHAQFALKPKIIDRYPDTNHVDTPLLPWVARTSMPRGIRARTRPPAPTFFTFVGWNIDSSKLYGACLMVFEKIHIHNQLQTVYIPKTLGFVSHYPYFCAFDVFLRCLWHVIPKKLIPLENLLIHYFYDIPAPAPSRKIAYDLGQMQVLLACRNEFDVPILELPMETAFTQLSKDRICFILKLLLLEKRVIFICGDMHQLTPVCELFVSLLFPLRWRHLYMPLLSHTMFQALMAKKPSKYMHQEHDTRYRYREDAPFIVGLPRFVYLNPEIQNNMPINSFLVFLDRNEITDYKKKAIHPNDMKSGIIVANLPQPLENTLRDAIHTLARILTMQVDGMQHNNQQSNPQNNHNQHQQHHHSSHSQHSKQPGAIRSKSSTTVMGGHNSMFISREYTLQAFRTMLAVMTKLLYLSAHQQFAHGNNHDDDDDRDSKKSSASSKVDKYASSKFIVQFRNTQLFQSVYAYYKRINGENDPYFKRMYLFYKEHQGHGKHFARRQTNNWENEPFDRKSYDKEIFKISSLKIRALESNNGKDNKLKKINEIAIKRSKKYKYPTVEFEMLEEVKDFLKMYIWIESTKRHHRRGDIYGGATPVSYYSQSPKSRVASRRGSKMSDRSRRKRKGSKASHRKKKSKESFYSRHKAEKGIISAASPASSTSNTYNLYPIPSSKKSSRSRHARTDSSKSNKSKSKSKSKSKRFKPKRKRGKHALSNSNSMDVTEVALQAKIEKFAQDLNATKDNLEKSLALCLEIESKIQRKIAKIKDIDRNVIMNDVGSIQGAATNAGYKVIDKTKGVEHWKMIIYEIFRDDVYKSMFTTIIGKLCGQYPQHKKELAILRSVVALFDEELSIASMSVRSLFLKQNGANSQGSSVSTNTTSTGTGSGTTNTTSTTTDDDSWVEDSEDEESEDDTSEEESSSEEDDDDDDTDDEDTDDKKSRKKSSKRKKKQYEEESSSEESSSEEETESSSSSGWSFDSNDSYDEEKEKNGSFTFDAGAGKFIQLDEFTFDKEEVEWFDTFCTLHNDELGSNGCKFMDEKLEKKQLVAVNVIDDYLIEKWKKSYKQRIKSKKPPLSAPGKVDKQRSNDLAVFNINHSVNVYKSQNRTNSSSSASSAAALSLRSRSKSPKPPPKSPKNKMSADALHMSTISPKSHNSSKFHQQHHQQQHNKKHIQHQHHAPKQKQKQKQIVYNHNNNNHNNNNHKNGNHHHQHHQYHKRKEQEDVYVD